jgi:hypothetical protein
MVNSPEGLICVKNYFTFTKILPRQFQQKESVQTSYSITNSSEMLKAHYLEIALMQTIDSLQIIFTPLYGFTNKL